MGKNFLKNLLLNDLCKVDLLFFVFLILNISWWVVSVILGYNYGIDVNPYLNNFGEIMLNGFVFILGAVIMIFFEDKIQKFLDGGVKREY